MIGSRSLQTCNFLVGVNRGPLKVADKMYSPAETTTPPHLLLRKNQRWFYYCTIFGRRVGLFVTVSSRDCCLKTSPSHRPCTLRKTTKDVASHYLVVDSIYVVQQEESTNRQKTATSVPLPIWNKNIQQSTRPPRLFSG